MTPENWIAVGSASVTAVLTGLGLYFGPKLAVKQSIKQFQSQKWWDERYKAYTTILDALSIIQHVNQDLYGQKAGGADPLFIPEEMRTALGKAHLEVNKYSSQGPHLISATAASALKKYQQERIHDVGTELVQMYERDAESAGRCIAIISAEAKQI
jgi:hypothetical protein